MILITGAYNVHGEGSQFIIQNIAPTIDANSPAFTQYAMENTIPGLGAPFVAVALFFFAFTTILAYYYQAETNIAYLRRTYKFPGDMLILKIVMLASVFYGSVKTAQVAWGLGDIGIGILTWLNVISILVIFFMSNPAVKALKDYEEQKRKKVNVFKFDPVPLDIKNAYFWEDRNKQH
tara:strand:- start:461 stop:994 length:534 start_codon:yes stop_codon:yes gene_type:complete